VTRERKPVTVHDGDWPEVQRPAGMVDGMAAEVGDDEPGGIHDYQVGFEGPPSHADIADGKARAARQ
jgi:hypothetical protein